MLVNHTDLQFSFFSKILPIKKAEGTIFFKGKIVAFYHGSITVHVLLPSLIG